MIRTIFVYCPQYIIKVVRDREEFEAKSRRKFDYKYSSFRVKLSREFPKREKGRECSPNAVSVGAVMGELIKYIGPRAIPLGPQHPFFLNYLDLEQSRLRLH